MSSNVESSKTLAAIGAILLFLSFIPVIGIIGIILVLIGMKGLSEHYRDESIYKSALTGVIFGIIGLIAVSVGSILVFFGGLFSAVVLGVAGILGGALALILILVVAFIFYLLMAVNFRRAFDSLAERSGESLFHSAGTLLFVGAILTIIGVGLVLIFIAWIIATIAFFSMNVSRRQYGQQPYGYASPPPPSAQPAQAARFCPNCGAPVQIGAVFCPNCGKQLPA